MKLKLICVILLTFICSAALSACETISTHEHNFTNYISDNNASCEQDGTKTAKCESCNITNTVTETGTALGHKYEDGVCSVCGKIDGSNQTPPLDGCEHIWATTKTEPDCDTPGSITYICINCKGSYTDPVPELGHDYEDGVCKECGAKENPTPPPSENCKHIKTTVEKQAATCETDGYERIICQECKATVSETILPSSGHIFILDGKILEKCESCDEPNPDFKTDVHEHTYEEAWSFDEKTHWKEPSCGCKDAIITKEAHIFRTADGAQLSECATCGYKNETVTPPSENCKHIYTATVINPTCYSEGCTLYECEKCGYSYKDNFVSTTKHSYDEYGVCTGCGTTGGTSNVPEMPDGIFSEAAVAMIEQYKAKFGEGAFIYYETSDFGELPEGGALLGLCIIMSSDRTRIAEIFQCPDAESCKILLADAKAAIANDPEMQGWFARQISENAFVLEGKIPVETDCEHSYSEDWSYDENVHWRESICGCNVRADEETHIFTEENPYDCAVCAYRVEENANPEKPEPNVTVSYTYESDSLSLILYSDYTVLFYELKLTSDGSIAKIQGEGIWAQDYSNKTIYVYINDEEMLYTASEGGTLIPKTDSAPCEHSYRAESVDATCEVGGYTRYICIYCDYSYTDNYINPIGHIYDENMGICINCNASVWDKDEPPASDDRPEYIPADAVKIGNSYYLIVIQGGMTRNEALAACEAMGGQLASITSADEQKAIEALNSSGTKLWIGGYRDDDGKWKWVSGETWDYTNWGEGEPNNSSNVVSNERYVTVWPCFWNDLANSNTLEQDGYICEWNLDLSFASPDGDNTSGNNSGSADSQKENVNTDIGGETTEENTGTAEGETTEENAGTAEGETTEENAGTAEGETAEGSTDSAGGETADSELPEAEKTESAADAAAKAEEEAAASANGK